MSSEGCTAPIRSTNRSCGMAEVISTITTLERNNPVEARADTTGRKKATAPAVELTGQTTTEPVASSHRA